MKDDLTADQPRPGWSRITRRWTDADGTRREEMFMESGTGLILRGGGTRAPATRWERLLHSPLGALIPPPWRGYIDCHGRPRRDGCPWNATLPMLLRRATVCQLRGHLLNTIWPGEWDMCHRCHFDVRYDD